MNELTNERSVSMTRVLGPIWTALVIVGCGSDGSPSSEESAKKVFLDQGVVKISPIKQAPIKELPLKLVAFKKTGEEEQEREGEKYRAALFEADFEWTEDFGRQSSIVGCIGVCGKKGGLLPTEGAVVYVLKDKEWRIFGAYSEPRPRTPKKQ